MSYSSKGKYEGEMSEGWYHGQGTFLYENGTKYVGNFKKGEFHGEGVLIYPNGGKFKGIWDTGKNISGEYEFNDGLQFNEPAKWDFCNNNDRRFYYEQLHGVNNPNILDYNKKLFKQIPEATYDTGDGYYDIQSGTIYTYEGEFLRVPNEEEEEWIKLKCKYNPKIYDETMYNDELLGKNDVVIQNVKREFKFNKYVKNQY